MGLVLNFGAILTPLTTEPFFDEDGCKRDIRGMLKAYSKDGGATLAGLCLETDGGKLYIHPELFRGLPVDKNCDMEARIELSRSYEEITMYFGRSVNWVDERIAKPLETKTIALELIMRLAHLREIATIYREHRCCADAHNMVCAAQMTRITACEKDTLLIETPGWCEGLKLIHRSCVDRWREENPSARANILLDPLWIPDHTAVTILDPSQ